jgi:hypothetical protein
MKAATARVRILFLIRFSLYGKGGMSGVAIRPARFTPIKIGTHALNGTTKALGGGLKDPERDECPRVGEPEHVHEL